MHAFGRMPSRLLATTVAACLIGTTMPLPAQAGMVGTEDAAADLSTDGQAGRDRLADLLTREDVRRALQARGVDTDDARARVAALSDAEASRLASSIDTLPAGGDVLGVIVTIFLVLLVTDILGLTKVFPFTRSIR